MSNNSILGVDSAGPRAAGRDVDALGPSDSSDSGSDVQGERRMATDGDTPDELGSLPVDLGSDSDSVGTGERGAAAGDAGRDAADILPDRVIGGEEGDEPYAADSDDGVEDLADEEDDDAETEAPGREQKGVEGSRVFRVAAGSLDEPGSH